MIYMDNAATTMHKPQAVIDAVVAAMSSMGNAGRGANEASQIGRASCRERVSETWGGGGGGGR